MSTNEAKDRAYTALQDRASELRRLFTAAMVTLRACAHDFSEGSQQRWMLAMRECGALRDGLWTVQQEIDALDNPDQDKEN